MKEIAIESTQFTGAASHIAGQMREAAGEVVDETRKQAEHMAKRASAVARDAASVVGASVQSQPLVGLLIAGAVGGLLGAMLARR